MSSLYKWVFQKLVLALIAFVAMFFIADGLGLVPQSMKDTGAWFGSNFTLLATLTMFVAACYVAVTYMRRKDRGKTA